MMVKSGSLKAVNSLTIDFNNLIIDTFTGCTYRILDCQDISMI